jgi:MFS family permease
MHLFAPDLLSEARLLPFGLLGAGLAVGLLLWLFGWWGHRFWIVLIATVGAGLYGLMSAGPHYRIQPFVAGLLLAVSAGVLALTLVRLVAYVAGGIAAWMLVHALAPLWDQPLLCFLVGGLIGLFLFRFWTMAFTSFLGALVSIYSGLCLADKLGWTDAASWAEQQGALLNWLCGVGALAGFAVQFFLERRRIRRLRKKAEDEDEDMDRHRYSSRSYRGHSHRRAG